MLNTVMRIVQDHVQHLIEGIGMVTIITTTSQAVAIRCMEVLEDNKSLSRVPVDAS